MVMGDAGNEEGAENSFVDPQPSWSAKTSSLFGYGKLVFQSASVATWQWMADDNSAIDQVGSCDFGKAFGPLLELARPSLSLNRSNTKEVRMATLRIDRSGRRLGLELLTDETN